MNELKKLKEFENILSEYRVSEDSQWTLKQTSLVLLTAATSSGRNTIIRQLLKTGEYHFIVSDTTRKPRVNDGVPERDGVEYWFRKEEEMLHDLKEGKFLEAEVIHKQQVSGISIRELEKAKEEQKIAITDIDIGGVQNVMDAKPDAIAVVVLPPNFEEWQRRIKHRGDMSDEEFNRRMETACKIFQMALDLPYFSFVINEDVDDAAAEIHQLARFGEHDSETQERGRKLAEQLLIQTQAYLNNL